MAPVPNDMRWLFWAYLCAGTIAQASAEPALPARNSDWFARVWRSDDGLPENNVTGVVQTPEGYLWVATHAGLARFDGVQFRSFPMPSDRGIRQRMIRASVLDHQHRLWMALEGGVVISLSPTTTNVLTAADGLHYGWPLVLTEDGEGAVWIGYAHGLALRIAQGRVTQFNPTEGSQGNDRCWLTTDGKGQVWFAKGGAVGLFRDGRFVTLLTLDANDVRLCAARAGGIWIGAGARLLKYEEGKEPSTLGNFAPLSGAVIASVLFEDRSGAVWMGTRASGLFRYDGTHFERVETSHAEILSVTEDREGNFWVGTGGGGLNRLRPRVLELQGAESGLPFDVVRSICEDASGRLWATMKDGALAWRETDQWQKVSTNLGWPGAPATCVTAGKHGEVWVGTDHGGLYRFQGGKFSALTRRDGLAGDFVRALFTDKAGGLWIGLEFTNCVQQLVTPSPPSTPLSRSEPERERGEVWRGERASPADGRWRTFTLPVVNQPVRTMAQDTKGNLWLGTGDGGLLRVEGEVLVDETPHTLAIPHAVQCLWATSDGSLWIGYAGVGVGRLKAGRFARIGVEHGLHDEFISNILADDQGWLWFASNRGIFKIRQAELDRVAEGRAGQVHSITYGRDEALPNLQASYGFGPGALRSRDGRLWIPTFTGLAVVRPERIPADRTAPPVIIERVLMDGQELALPRHRLKSEVQSLKPPPPATSDFRLGTLDHSLRLPPGHRKLEFEFTALSFIAPENFRFRHWLEGLDEDWVEGGMERTASYSRLPAGDYRFRVAACNNLGVWTEQDVGLTFAVAPFYWQTWWFRLGVGGTVLAAFGWSIRRFEKRKTQRRMETLERAHAIERERMRIARDLHDEMGANLTQIALLSELAQSDFAKPEQAKGHIDEVFRTARSLTRSLDEIVWAVNPAGDTLEQFVAHLCTFAPRFLQSAGVSCRLDVPEELPAIPLSAGVRHHLHLSLKECLHNIAKHAHATEVWLRLKLTSVTLTLILEDNGRGFQPAGEAAPGADGLENLRQRMREIGGSIEQKSPAGCGTVTTLLAPLKPEAE